MRKHVLLFLLVLMTFTAYDSFSQSKDMVVIKFVEIATKNLSHMIIVAPDNSISKVDLVFYDYKTLEKGGENIIALKNELVKWEEKGYTEQTWISVNDFPTCFLRKKKD